MKSTYTEADIRELLATSDRAVERAVLAIYRAQTPAEQADHATTEANGVGFNGVDAELLTDFAEQLKGIGFARVNGAHYPRRAPKHLTEKQLVIARHKMPKYARQLALLANARPALGSMAPAEVDQLLQAQDNPAEDPDWAALRQDHGPAPAPVGSAAAALRPWVGAGRRPTPPVLAAH